TTLFWSSPIIDQSSISHFVYPRIFVHKGENTLELVSLEKCRSCALFFLGHSILYVLDIVQLVSDQHNLNHTHWHRGGQSHPSILFSDEKSTFSTHCRVAIEN